MDDHKTNGVKLALEAVFGYVCIDMAQGVQSYYGFIYSTNLGSFLFWT